MDESEGSGFDDFSVEMEDFEYVQVKKFDRVWMLGEGGSFSQKPLIHEGTVYVGSMDHNVYAIDARTGNLRWKFRAEGGIYVATPVISDGVLYIGSLDHNLYALDTSTGKLIWKFETRDRIMSSVSISGGRLYFGSNDHNLYCLDRRTGTMIWKFATMAEVISTPAVSGGMIFFGSYDHSLYCLREDTGTLAWKFETQGDIFNTTPFLIHEGLVYFGSFDNYMRAVDVRTGRLAWKFLTGKYGMQAGPTLENGVLYQTNREGVLYALTLKGDVLWKFTLNYIIARPIMHGNRIYVGAGDDNLYCLGPDGKVLWKFRTQGELWWMPSVWDGKVYFTSTDCFLYAVDINTHELAWKFRAQGAPSYIPPPFDSFELTVKKAADDSGLSERGGRKTYGIEGLDEETAGTYKSHVTYRMSTQYASKGKYQVDSDEEEF